MANSIKIGVGLVDALRVGASVVDAVYVGASKVYSKVKMTLSGGSASHFVIGGPATAGIRINTDGTIDKREGTTYTQIGTLTDWISPKSAALSTDEFRVTGITGTFTSSPIADGSWVAVGSGAGLEWNITQTPTGVGSVSFTIEARHAAGATEASGAYSVTAENSV